MKIRLLLVLLLPAVATAQETPEGAGSEPAFSVVPGPVTGRLGSVAAIDVPDGFSFVPTEAMPAFNQRTGNLHSPNDLGALVAEEGWIVFFTFDPTGYVEDDQQELDAGALLESMRQGDEPANRQRREMGFEELWTVGWSREPYYDASTKNLNWGLQLRTGSGGQVINHQIRLLGRRGVMSVIVVDSPETVAESVAAFEPLLAGFDYTAGNRYAEFRSGDKVAQYGLAALVAGGGVAVAAKTGLLAKLAKMLKPLILVVIGGLAAFGRRIRAFFSRQPTHTTTVDT